jgi:hypothetical protein
MEEVKTQDGPQQDVIGVFEDKYPNIAQNFRAMQEEQYNLFAGKMLDYGLHNITLGSPLETVEEVNFSIQGIWLRCSDKINRIKNLLLNNTNFVENESLVDTWMDLSNYGIIARMVQENKWKR